MAHGGAPWQVLARFGARLVGSFGNTNAESRRRRGRPQRGRSGWATAIMAGGFVLQNGWGGGGAAKARRARRKMRREDVGGRSCPPWLRFAKWGGGLVARCCAARVFVA